MHPQFNNQLNFLTITSATTGMVTATLFIDFFPPVQLIYTNKVPFRVNMQPHTLQAISISCLTIADVKFNQCKLHMTNYLIFLHQTFGTMAVEGHMTTVCERI